MTTNTLYLAGYHDRHTDDEFLIFMDEEKAKRHVRQWMSAWGDSVQENQQYGDWCLFVSDDYYGFVQEVRVVS